MAKEEVFNKTLAFFCALLDKGCSFNIAVDGEDYSNITEHEDNISTTELTDEYSETMDSGRDCRFRSGNANSCKGKIGMYDDMYGRPFVQYDLFLRNIMISFLQQTFLRCEHRKPTDTAHLVLRNLDEFEIAYLRALLDNDINGVYTHEKEAMDAGYGPRLACTYTASPSTQKQLCRKVFIFCHGANMLTTVH